MAKVSPIEPTSGPNAGGKTAAKAGTDPVNPGTVEMGAAQTTRVQWRNPSRIGATTSAGSGTAHMAVTAPGGASATGGANRPTLTWPLARSSAPSRPDSRLAWLGLDGLLACLVGTAPVIPALAALATAMAYSSNASWWPVVVGPLDLGSLKPYPVLEGTFLVLVLWGVYVAFSWGLARDAFHNANVHEATMLSMHADQIVTRLHEAVQHMPELGEGRAPNEFQQLAYNTARTYSTEIEKERCRRSINWVLATGYVNLWTMVHRAEEALFALIPPEDVVAEALYDQLRLTGSTMNDHDNWLLKLRLALRAFDPAAEKYMGLVLPSIAGNLGASDGATAVAQASGQAPSGTVAMVSEDVSARAVLRDVRRAIDEFRDDSRDKLVRACNRLKAAVFVAGFAAYILLVAEIGYKVNSNYIHAAVVLSLVGVIVGFFGRLNLDAGVNSAAEDYGLSATHMRQIPVFSGMAAIGGVLLAQAVQGTTKDPFQAAFTIDFAHLLTAAIFGLAPGLLIARLQQQTTDQYKRDLSSTESSHQASAP